MGSVADFLDAPELLHAFDHLADAVRKGGTVMSDEGTVSYDNPIWVQFARSMAPMMKMPAEVISQLVDADKGGKCRVLDIAAGHGLSVSISPGTIPKLKLWRWIGPTCSKLPKRTRGNLVWIPATRLFPVAP